jgi:acylphosphatase
MTELACLKVVVYGRVQGVFFRDFTRNRARELGLTGYVRNLPLGQVEVLAEGERDKLDELMGYLYTGPPAAVVEKLKAYWSEYSGKYVSFEKRY